MVIHRLQDYIERAIKTNGIFPNAGDVDIQFWDGYRVFVREGLDKYDSVDDWLHDFGGWEDGAQDGHGPYTEYLIRDARKYLGGLGIMRGCMDVIDAAFAPYNLGFLGDLTTKNLEKENKLMLIKCDNEVIYQLVNMNRRRRELPELPYPNSHPDVKEFLDTTSQTAKIESMRMQLNIMEFNGSYNSS